MYQLFSPPVHLQNIVRYYWLLDLTADRKKITEYIFAYPYVNWVFTMGRPYTVKDNFSGPLVIKNTSILGPRTNFAEYLHPEGNLAFGVTFQLGSTPSILKEDTQLITNKIILQEDILPSSRWLTPFFNDVALEDFVPALNGEIAKLTNNMQQNGYFIWSQFLDLITVHKHYNTSASYLAKELKISQRHLQRITNHFAGLPPKHIQSMIRCRQAIKHIQRTGRVTDFFHYGYYDQNHFIKEVKRWTGHTPKALFLILGA
ncbi:AraC family transcriptional regulator [Echinicola sp. 20G]|uniref:helix-turn-helix domain-containing protein n=1 Tax=Echinicola sp. 20G TaxID=2781961 RepID=UPI00190FECB6|nr:AraC family transcriptional regulator [Echinicola sp. 20G]